MAASTRRSRIVRAFIARYNAEWLIETNGYLSPAALRRQYQLAAMPMAE